MQSTLYSMIFKRSSFSSSRSISNYLIARCVQGYGAKKNRIHYSGPLMPPGGNLDEMLKEHERQIQAAVRKARLDRGRAKNHGETGLSESLLFSGRNGTLDASENPRSHAP